MCKKCLWPLPEYCFSISLGQQDCSPQSSQRAITVFYLADCECRIACVFDVSGSCLSWRPEVFYLSNHEAVWFLVWDTYSCVGTSVSSKVHLYCLVQMKTSPGVIKRAASCCSWPSFLITHLLFSLPRIPGQNCKNA